MTSLLSSLLLLRAAVSPAHARVAAWWNGVGPQIILQNETTGLIRYSRCNLFDNPKYSYTDGSVLSLTYKPKNDTPLAGSGYWSTEFTAASIYYLTERYEIANGLFHCNMTTGLFESKGNWIISKLAPSIHQNTGLASLLLGEEGGYRLFYHNKDGQIAQLGYTTDDGQWLYKGMISKDVNTVPALGAVFPTGKKENITVVSTRDEKNIGVTRYNSEKTWWRSTLPQALEDEGGVITSKTNKTDIAINATAPVNFTLPAYDAATKGMGISIDSNYTRFIWYIGTDKKIHQIGNTNYFWSIRDNQTEAIWPEADEPNASLGVASDFGSSLVHLYYMAKGKLVQVKYEHDSWKAASNVPEPPAEQTTTSSTPAPTTIDSPVSDEPDVPNEGLSPGAKAGIGVGVSLGVTALGVLLAVLILMKRKKHEGFERPPQQNTSDDGGSTLAPTTPAPSYGVPHPQNPGMVHYNNIAPQYHNNQMAHYDGYAWDQKQYAPIPPSSPPASQPYSSPQSTYAPVHQLDSTTRPTELYAQPLYELPNQTNSHELVAEPPRRAAEQQQQMYETQQFEQQRREMYQQQQQAQMYAQQQPPQYQQHPQ
ncbi:hypothetical protein B0T21DRAFT_166997 [Apiosordaria backusii]|uniref:Uncharacterized protein n=1 Tax=Apiosordaria backusii TaxID=314023 RepID=A0AA40BNS1_9PEZI|nr:hypothetical protein B0T21DRAFT_166997 [Apiosordaria backusii]